MTPRQAQIALLSFALLAAGVAFNALVLQRKSSGATEAAAGTAPALTPPDRLRKGQDSAPAGRSTARSSENAREDQLLRIARFAPQSAKIDAMPEPAEDEADSATVGAIQRELKQRNYGPLPVDGILRPATRAAIMAFEYDRGLPLTGDASAQTLKLILLGTPAGGSGSGAGKVRSTHAEEIVRGVQKSLVALGYQSAGPDGRLGDETIKAIRDFEMDRGFVPKGRVSAELLARLSEAAASTKR
jgi:peptidoglycan hydrolase-like protein with peptidoglycan-binding domain